MEKSGYFSKFPKERKDTEGKQTLMVLHCYSAMKLHLKKYAVSTLSPEGFRPWLVLTIFFIYLEVLFLQEKERLSKVRKKNPQSTCFESHIKSLIHGDNSACKKHTEATKFAFYSCRAKYSLK